MINSRFTVAVHLLALMSAGRERYAGMPITSEMASESVNTNPVVIRRILGLLRKAGLVSSQPGPAGGWLLERDPDQITLRDVYRAVKDESLFSMHHRPPSAQCHVGRNIQETLEGYFSAAECALAEKLGEHTIADVVDDVLGRVRAEAL
ncbi:MAG TPA: Rrf2 family transcriptional regulator [Chloroflexota bacterium]